MSIQQFNENNHVSFIVDLLYKNRDRSGDVNFVYHGPVNSPVTIPAHRIILAAGSTILDDLFFGPHKVTGDIPTRSNTVPSQTFEAFIALLYGKS